MRAFIVMTFRAVATIGSLCILFGMLATFEPRVPWFALFLGMLFLAVLFFLGTFQAWEVISSQRTFRDFRGKLELQKDEAVLAQYRAVRRSASGSHPNCRLVATNQRLILWDSEGDTCLFELKQDVLNTASIRKTGGTDLVITLPGGAEHEIGLEAGAFEKIARVIKAP